MQLAILPLLVAAFFIQSVIPVLNLPFNIALLIDDAASFIVAIALVIAIPYVQIWAKVTAMDWGWLFVKKWLNCMAAVFPSIPKWVVARILRFYCRKLTADL